MKKVKVIAVNAHKCEWGKQFYHPPITFRFGN